MYVVFFYLTAGNTMVPSPDQLSHFTEIKRSQVNCLSEIPIPSS